MKLELFFRGDWLCAVIEGEKCAHAVKPVWASPLSRANRYMAILDSKDKEFAFLSDPQRELDATSWQNVQSELRKRDFTARISRIESANEEGGAAYWSAQTDRGPRDFVTNNHSQNALWFGDNRLLLLDADGNRFEIPDISRLDARSRAFIEGIL